MQAWKACRYCQAWGYCQVWSHPAPTRLRRVPRCSRTGRGKCTARTAVAAMSRSTKEEQEGGKKGRRGEEGGVGEKVRTCTKSSLSFFPPPLACICVRHKNELMCNRNLHKCVMASCKSSAVSKSSPVLPLPRSKLCALRASNSNAAKSMLQACCKW